MQRVAEEIIQAALEGKIQTKNELQQMKRHLCRRYHLSRFPSDVEILSFATEEERQKIIPLLRKKPTRTLSGVAVIAVMTEPMECPGQCIYCPTNLPTAPKAYVGEEPATLRARQNEYDPFLQVTSRLEQLQAMGHSIEKIELIVMGGTFLSASEEYQRNFIKRSLDAMTGLNAKDLPEAIHHSENSSIRPVGITIETRPDYCRFHHVDMMLNLGTTRVELGVQTIYDDIYDQVGRGHKVADVISATQIAKDAGLKINYHIMPGLPGSSPERDRQMFKELFQHDEFKPDMLKIYPCLVLRGSELFELWRKGDYEPYSTEQVIELLADVMPSLPPWVRIQRMQRDIPKNLIVAGPNAGNLTQLVFQRAQEKGFDIRTIRFREIGFYQRAHNQPISTNSDATSLALQVHSYRASEGTEFFLALEDSQNDSLIGYLRLRLPSLSAHRSEIKGYNAALLRELHVYGLSIDLGEKSQEAWQHRGVGKRLLTAAEEQALQSGCTRIVCTSGIGARQYYRRHGYRLDGPYMMKRLNGP